MKFGFFIIFAVAFGALSQAAVRADVSGMIRVIDGDTIDVGTTRVRLFGIDAPESDQLCTSVQGKQWPCGEWVTATVTAQYAGRLALCSAQELDRYGRLVASCDVDGHDLGKRLVADGLAFAYRKYSMDYDLDEKRAAVQGIGLHGSRFQSPSEFRDAKAGAPAPLNTSCNIKGNISANGARIFHVPTQKDYRRTTIREEKGERWFCSAQDARAAGWRAAKR